MASSATYDTSSLPNPDRAALKRVGAQVRERLAQDTGIYRFPTEDAEIFALGDIQAVRRDDNYYRKYLGGSFGAVPNIG